MSWIPWNRFCWVTRAGRAEKLGLAISLVSTVREKVWYCTQKGYKPWLKPKQADVRLNEQGGHTLWYDEQALLKVRARSWYHGLGGFLLVCKMVP